MLTQRCIHDEFESQTLSSCHGIAIANMFWKHDARDIAGKRRLRIQRKWSMTTCGRSGLLNLFCSYFNSRGPVARNPTEMVLEKHGVDCDLWGDILRTAGAVEAVYWRRFEHVAGVLQGTALPHEEWAALLCTTGAVEAIYADNLVALVAALEQAQVPAALWARILRSKAMSAAVENNSFQSVAAAMAGVPAAHWADVLQSRGAQQAVLSRNFARVAAALRGVAPELWAGVLESDGFAEAVAQDDTEQVISALAAVPACFWAGILHTNGAFEAINWKNFGELTAALRRHDVPVDTWEGVLNMNTTDVYEVLYNDALPAYVRQHLV